MFLRAQSEGLAWEYLGPSPSSLRSNSLVGALSVACRHRRYVYAHLTTHMHRTTILLSHELRAKAETAARKRGISLSEMIRRLLSAAVGAGKPIGRESDSLFRPRHLMTQRNPRDIAAKHDDYLYGRRSESMKK